MQAKGISWRYINKSYIPNVELKKKKQDTKQYIQCDYIL